MKKVIYRCSEYLVVREVVVIGRGTPAKELLVLAKAGWQAGLTVTVPKAYCKEV